MAKVLIPHICLLMVLSRAESCFMPSSQYVVVADFIPVGNKVTMVEASGCDTGSVLLYAKDPSFTVRSDGTVVAMRGVYVPPGGRTFTVLARDSSAQESEMEVHLVHRAQRQKTEQGVLKRTKRRWSPPPITILENDEGPYPKQLERIVSDSEVRHKVYYIVTGHGVNQDPSGLFSLDRDSGMLTVYRPIDREIYPSFKITAKVYDTKTHQETDQPLDIHIEIDDVNDNAPQFVSQMKYNVLEQASMAVVGQVSATDKDKPGTLHSKIRYSLLTGTNLFAIHPETGVITTTTNSLDRETLNLHNVVVEIRDLDGSINGLFTTGTAQITVDDINDNPPTFPRPSFDASVSENVKEKLILEIPVEDRDLINTANWRSKFVITKGNENGNFRIDSDPKTNKGLLYVIKPLDYEKTKYIPLEVMAQNEAELSGTTQQWQTARVNVSVVDVDEGPEFTAPTVRFLVKENTPNGTKIGTYTAQDPETKSSSGIKYYKVSDPAGWVTVDRNTGELRVANTIDRESAFALNGTYNVIMRAVDTTSKTGTGTVIIQVEDINDNVPEVPSNNLVLCDTGDGLGSVVVVAEDKDQPPFSYPFTFSLPQDNDGKWSVTRLNDTAAVLKPIKALPVGRYNVDIDIKDLQGYGKTQTVTVRICQCKNGACSAAARSTRLSSLGYLALLLPLLALLLLCLLLIFFCVTKRDKVDLDDGGDSGGILLKSNTEGIGEEVNPSLIAVPSMVQTDKGMGMQNSGWQGLKSTSTLGGHSMLENGIYRSGMDTQEFYTTHYDNQYSAQLNAGQLVGSSMGMDSRYFAQDSSLHHTWQTNGRVLGQRLQYLQAQEDGCYADDIAHSYAFEGKGSAAGSVGCCSNLGDKENLDFLNTLGPKFKTLADVCTKR
ncbi:desmocollin 2-like protein [Betta splendens]|uniref:Desmocollin 2-like protein n=1 Tax=Betta splendens TaxID=158456 RepID=A0A6P7KYF2_BETSP|nr:desmocollin 2-like protein [Betta splendens]